MPLTSFGPDWSDDNNSLASSQNSANSALAQMNAASAGAAGQMGAAQAGADASRYGAKQSADASRFGSQLQYNLGAETLAQKQARYNQLFPLLSGAFNTINGQVGQGGVYGGAMPLAPAMPAAPSYGGGGGSGGGGSGSYGYGLGGPAPTVSAPAVGAAPGVGGYPSSGGLPPPSFTGPHPVLSEGQIQQQVNQQRATNDASAAGQVRRQTEDLGGRGVGANSPLAMALRAQIGGQNLNANTLASTDARLNAAKLNADNQQAYDLADLQSRTALGSAGINAGASMYGSAQAAAASQYGSQVGAQASMFGSQAGANANMYGSKQSADASRANAQTAAQASNYNAGLGYNSSTYGDQLNYQANLAQVAAQRQNSILAALAGLAG